MCHVWQHPTHPAFEVPLDVLAKLPSGFGIINITGGEPTLRADLFEICTLLYPKTRVLEISTNGLRSSILEKILRKYPNIKIRISIEGISEINDTIRGERNGYSLTIDTMNRLLATGATDLGFATTIQDENIDQLLPLYKYCRALNVEFATSSIHNAFQFHKNDNYIYSRIAVAKGLEPLVTAMLASWDVKTWFRAYLNLGLMRRILGLDPVRHCTATDAVFIDPWCDIYACNVRNDLLIGNLRDQSWQEIINSERFSEVRKLVARCQQNCWLAGNAKGAMRMRHFHRLPKLDILYWVILNKAKLFLGRGIAFEKYVDYNAAPKDASIVKRLSYLGTKQKAVLQAEQSCHYSQLPGYFNR